MRRAHAPRPTSSCHPERRLCGSPPESADHKIALVSKTRAPDKFYPGLPFFTWPLAYRPKVTEDLLPSLLNILSTDFTFKSRDDTNDVFARTN